MRVRILERADAPALERFLRPRSDTSMILRGNAHAAGVVDRGERHQGTYAAAFDGSKMVGVVAHYQNGNLIPQASRGLARLSRAAVTASGRAVAGALGPAQQVTRTLTALGLSSAPTRLDTREGLYTLELSALRLPEMLRAQRITARPVEAADREPLIAWFEAYTIEALGARRGKQTRADAEQRFERSLDGQPPGYVLLRDGEPVAYSGFNATVPDAVQVGGVYTPPGERGKGFARGVVASSLLAARASGVERAVLFTDDDNTPAIAAYEALGFSRVGDFRLTLLA